MTEEQPKKDAAQPSAPSASPDDSEARPRSDYELWLETVSRVPDYAKLLTNIDIPDYAKLLTNFDIPDYARLLTSIDIPDYAKLLTSVDIPDYAKLLTTIDAPDYAKLLGSDFPRVDEYSKLLGSTFPRVPEYAKLLEAIDYSPVNPYSNLPGSIDFKLPNDYAKPLYGARVPDDYEKLLGNIARFRESLPTETTVTASSDQSSKLLEEIQTLKKSAAEQFKALTAATSGSEEQKREIQHLRSTVEQLREKERLGFLLERVHGTAQEHLRQSHEFQEKFLAGECSAFVLSVDIRRSTELMLKARTAEKFADFISRLCIELTAIVVNSLGVFDKFTGDGILAFFPDFFSGPDAGYRVLAAADGCHAAFERHYRDSRTSFKSVLTNVGLGIGIDYGSVRLVQVAGGLTVVGEPVVYACRLSSGPPKTTLANQPAFEQISAKFGGFCFSEEQSHEIKHEGAMLAYEVRLNGRGYAPSPPEWLVDSAKSSKPDAGEAEK